MARLVYSDSSGREQFIELNAAQPVLMGRGTECTIRTDDAMVSRKHAHVALENGRYFIQNLSVNGTQLNNVRIEKQALGHGDVVQCGSLVVRFLDDRAATPPIGNPQLAAPQPPQQQQKKGGTMVLERAAPPPMVDNNGAPIRVVANSSPPPMYGPPDMPPPVLAPPPIQVNGPMPGMSMAGPPGMPFGNPGGMPNIPPPQFGGPPVMPVMPIQSKNSLPYGGPPEMPNAPAVPSPSLPYGGPPDMPGLAPGAPRSAASPTIRPPNRVEPSMFERGGPIQGGGAARPIAPAAADDAEKKVLVDLGLEHDPQKADAEIKQLRSDLDKANASYEREVADGKRVRAESATLRDRIDELRSQIKDREEQASAHDRVANELRDELLQTRTEMSRLRNELGEMSENLLARERQVGRAHEETAKIREDMEDLNRQLLEVARTKDEGWKKLNDQLTEIEHLREVINEQERMLEERRVGLISQEEVIKELRADKERSLKQIAQLRAERDEAATTATRVNAQVLALEDENKRLGRMVVEAQTEAGRGGASPSANDHMIKLQGELRDARVELKKIEADRDHLKDTSDRSTRDRDKLESRLAQLEVELQEAQHAKLAAESARNVAQDALAKSEVARHRAAEDALSSAKARETASTSSDDARRELEKLRRKVSELEAKGTTPVAGPDVAQMQHERDAAARAMREAQDKVSAAEQQLKTMQSEVAAAKMDAQAARAEAARAKAAAATASELVEGGDATGTFPPLALRDTAREVYDSINDILSAMRNRVRVVQDSLADPSAGDHSAMMAEMVEALIDDAETAKGALRGLKDLAQG